MKNLENPCESGHVIEFVITSTNGYISVPRMNHEFDEAALVLGALLCVILPENTPSDPPGDFQVKMKKGTALGKAIGPFDDRVPRALPWAIVLRPAGAGLKPPLAMPA